MQKDIISVIVPCYNEQESVEIFHEELMSHTKNIYNAETEIIFIDDGSEDDTLRRVKKLAEMYPYVKYISFSRNFGKEAAIYAGLKATKGNFICTMDVDLQDPPSLLPQMYEELKNGEYDMIGTRRTTRKGEPPVRSFFSKMFYKIMNKISKTEFVDGARDFRLMTRQVAESVLSLKEYNRFSKGIMSWVGFRTKWISYENIERSAGKTKWNFAKLFLYSMEAIMAFSTIPLSIASFLGLLFCLIALVWIFVIVIKTLIWGDPVAGYPSMMCVIFLLSGVQLFSVGIIGQYLSKTYMEVKDRPIYITKESNIDEKI